MKNCRILLGNRSGVAAVEFALVAPLLLALLFGIWNAGFMLFADNAIRDAVEAGARQATVFPRPTQAQLTQIINNRYFGPKAGVIAGPTFAYGTRNSAPIVTISMTYTHQINVPYMANRSVTFDHARTVYLAPEGRVSTP